MIKYWLGIGHASRGLCGGGGGDSGGSGVNSRWPALLAA
jgi:hypothetical protein